MEKKAKKVYVKITTMEDVSEHFQNMLKGKLQLIEEKDYDGKTFGTLLNEKGQRLRIPKLNYELKNKKK